MNKPAAPSIINIRTFADDRGHLGVVENIDDIPFEIRRFYFLYGIGNTGERGAHAHKALHQCMIALNGAFNIQLIGGGQTFDFRLDSPAKGLLVPPGYWRVLSGFEKNAVCGVLASEKYDSDDYIHNLDDFYAWEEKGRP